jgi:hypothetical protein
VWVVIYKYMEATLGISLYICLYFKLPKMLCLSYYLLCSLFNKITEQEAEWALLGSEGAGEGSETKYTHVSKYKMIKKKRKEKQNRNKCISTVAYTCKLSCTGGRYI